MGRADHAPGPLSEAFLKTFVRSHQLLSKPLFSVELMIGFTQFSEIRAGNGGNLASASRWRHEPALLPPGLGGWGAKLVLMGYVYDLP